MSRVKKSTGMPSVAADGSIRWQRSAVCSVWAMSPVPASIGRAGAALVWKSPVTRRATVAMAHVAQARRVVTMGAKPAPPVGGSGRRRDSGADDLLASRRYVARRVSGIDDKRYRTNQRGIVGTIVVGNDDRGIIARQPFRLPGNAGEACEFRVAAGARDGGDTGIV